MLMISHILLLLPLKVQNLMRYPVHILLEKGASCEIDLDLPFFCQLSSPLMTSLTIWSSMIRFPFWLPKMSELVQALLISLAEPPE